MEHLQDLMCRNARNGARPIGLAFSRNDRRQPFAIVENLVEIPQAFDSREYFARVFAEQRHKAGVPDPNLRIAERFVHIGRLRHSGDLPDVVEGELPRLFV